MRVVAVCAAVPGEVRRLDGQSIRTGIGKVAVPGPVRIEANGIAEDAVLDTANHGGPDQALYAYSLTDYAAFGDVVGVEPTPGTFGENLVLDDWGTDRVEVGDRYGLGATAVVEVTAPRVPCGTFAARMHEVAGVESGWVKRFVAERRPGAYLRVLVPGEVSPADEVVRQPGGSGLGLVEFFDAWYGDPDADMVQRILAAPIAGRARRHYEAHR